MSASNSLPWYAHLGAGAGLFSSDPKYAPPRQPPRPLIVGISGRAGSGKDTFAAFLMERLRHDGVHVVKYSFADPLKEAAKDLFCLSDGDVYTQEGKKKDNPFWGSRLGDAWGTNRAILQRFGTEVMRKAVHDEFWLHRADAFVEGINGVVVVPDVRFLNEAKWVARHGGVMYRMTNLNQEPVPSGLWHRRLLRLAHRARFKPYPAWLHPSEDPLPASVISTELRCASVRVVEDVANVHATLLRIRGGF